MKIGIFTFHCANNQGAVLQAYGLQEYLKSLGHTVYVIDYKPKYITDTYKTIKIQLPQESAFTRLKLLIHNILTIPIRWKRNEIFNSFRRKYLNLYCLNLNCSHNDFDAFIFGSDQIWSPFITKGFDPIYFGDFQAAENKKIIAYAASVGSVQDIIGHETYLLQQLSKFSAIGVRENSLSEWIEKQIPRLNCQLTIDPVLLAGQATFEKIIKPQKRQRKYLLLFQIGSDKYVEKMAYEIASLKGLDMIKMTSYTETLKDRKNMNCTSPLSFLSYLKNASYVVTSSFHGTVFSILFKKDFTSICLNKVIGERIDSLLHSLGLSHRMVTEIGKPMDITPIDYTNTQDAYRTLQRASHEFLKNNL